MIRSMIFGTLLAGSMSAFAQSTTFIAEGVYVGGSALISPPHGGEYVYGEPASTHRIKTKAIAMAAVPRQSYTFLSAEEEQALLAFRDSKMAEEVKAKVINSRKAHFKKTNKLNWPKVILRGDEVCVPELASADAEDWQDHLTCYNVAEKGN